MSEIETCFKRVDYDLNTLLNYIDIGDIGLPDIQRPFVWTNAKVRDLFDSMYRGFPVGYLLFWENGLTSGTKAIGLDGKAHSTPARLIVDGQQRLTSLYSVFRGKKILDEEFRERKIDIAFHPIDGRFEVTDAAIRKDHEWIPSISDIWSPGNTSYCLITDFVARGNAQSTVSEDQVKIIARNIDHLFDLQRYPFTALEIAPNVDEEQVADIFVRINSEGVKLNQADFILTLLSVFWDEGRHALERFCREAREVPAKGTGASPFNHLIQPDPDQLLRVAVAVGFQRARLKYVYQVLRGKDLDTGNVTSARRDQQFQILLTSQAQTLDLARWHQFLSSLIGAGFRSSELISSQTAILYSYSLYLIGKNRFSLQEHTLQRLIGRWFYFATLTGRYTGSPETMMDADLNRVKSADDGNRFISILNEVMASELTEDFWEITLPANLESSAARSPELFCYMAAQNLLDAPVLFSHKKVSNLLDPTIRLVKKPLEKHHLFPRAFLIKEGITDLKKINQLANFALLEWPDNIDIRDAPPTEYVPQFKSRFNEAVWVDFHRYHALPAGWESLTYDEFLLQRRRLMAGIIRRGIEALR